MTMLQVIKCQGADAVCDNASPSEMLHYVKCRQCRCFAKSKCHLLWNADVVDASPTRNASHGEMPTFVDASPQRNASLREMPACRCCPLNATMLPYRKCRRQPMLSHRQCFAQAKRVLYFAQLQKQIIILLLVLWCGCCRRQCFAINGEYRYMITADKETCTLQQRQRFPIEWGVEKHPLVISYACPRLSS